MRTLNNGLLIIVACLITVMPSILNGYPILFSDTGTYIVSGMELFVPIDRPVFYGIFIRIMSFYSTLWGVLIAQTLLSNLFLLAIVKYLFPVRRVFLCHLILVINLTLTTSYAYFVNHMIPDLFSPLLILGIAFILARPGSSIWLIGLLLVFLILANLVHLSNLLITTSVMVFSLAGGLIFIKKQWFRQRARALLYLAMLTLASWSIPLLVNHSLDAGWVITRAKNIYIMGNHVESGLMREYLNAACADRGYDLCRWADSLPESAVVFLWDPSSPLYKGGCNTDNWENCWLEKDEEYGRIISDMMGTTRFLKIFMGQAVSKGFLQNIRFGIQHRSPETGGSPVHYPMERHFPKDYDAYISALQQQKGLYFNTLSVVQYMVVSISLIFLGLVLLVPRFRKRNPVSWRIFTLGIFLAVMTNGFVTAIFSHVTARYQCRVIWLIPFVAFLFLFQFGKTLPGNLRYRKKHLPRSLS